MGSTSRNTFPQCGERWILPRKTKMENEGITRKISLIDHFVLGKLFLIITLGNKLGYFGHSLLKLFVFLNFILVIPSIILGINKSVP